MVAQSEVHPALHTLDKIQSANLCFTLSPNPCLSRFDCIAAWFLIAIHSSRPSAKIRASAITCLATRDHWRVTGTSRSLTTLSHRMFHGAGISSMPLLLPPGKSGCHVRAFRQTRVEDLRGPSPRHRDASVYSWISCLVSCCQRPEWKTSH
jgi:hypothetical protein